MENELTKIIENLEKESLNMSDVENVYYIFTSLFSFEISGYSASNEKELTIKTVEHSLWEIINDNDGFEREDIKDIVDNIRFIILN